LAEDISLSLQSLGFVLELARTRVGAFGVDTAIKPSTLEDLSAEVILGALHKIEVVLADIPVFDIDVDIALKVRYGQIIPIASSNNIERIWLRANNKILAIGSLQDGYFNSARVLNV
jgi:tRNA pseudouridine55 synthase